MHNICHTWTSILNLNFLIICTIPLIINNNNVISYSSPPCPGVVRQRWAWRWSSWNGRRVWRLWRYVLKDQLARSTKHKALSIQMDQKESVLSVLNGSLQFSIAICYLQTSWNQAVIVFTDFEYESIDQIKKSVIVWRVFISFLQSNF